MTSLKRAPYQLNGTCVIKPIYKKKGDKKCAANYRGSTLTSCLGKLFTSILQNRLNEYIEQHNILNPEQLTRTIKSCVKIEQSTLTGLFSCNKGIRQGDGLSPVLFSLFMNDLPQYFKRNKCPVGC